MCPECDDRGWVPRFKGDIHGDVCLACADKATRELVAKAPTSKRLVKGPGSAPISDGVVVGTRENQPRRDQSKAPKSVGIGKGAVVANGARDATPKSVKCSTPDCPHNRANLALFCDRCYAREYNRKNKARGTRTRATGMTAEEVKEARRMRSQFKTVRAIAEHFGVTEGTIHNHLKR